MNMAEETAEVLILYYSAKGAVANLARLVARGVEEVDGARAKLRTVPKVAPAYQPGESDIPVSGPPYADLEDLAACHALILGSPTRFGQMAAPLRYFLDGTSGLWLSGALADKPAGAFTATASLHGGQESTLLGMLLPLLHHGMYLVGLPYSENGLLQTQGGGSPYGAGQVTGGAGGDAASPSEIERDLCVALGRRVATAAVALERGRRS